MSGRQAKKNSNGASKLPRTQPKIDSYLPGKGAGASKHPVAATSGRLSSSTGVGMQTRSSRASATVEVRAVSTPSQDSDESAVSKIRCLCGVTSEVAGHWVMCDRCSSWSHSACYELSAEAAKANAFTCFFCSPSLLSCVLAAKFPHLSSRAVPLSVFGELVSKVSQLEDHLHHELRSSRLVMADMQNQVERQSRLAPPVRPIPPPITGVRSRSSRPSGSADAGASGDSSPFRIIWGFPVKSTASKVRSALAPLLSEGDMLSVSVKKSYRSGSVSRRSRWWFTVRGPESVLQSLDLAWADSAASFTWRLQSSLRVRPLPPPMVAPPSSLIPADAEGKDPALHPALPALSFQSSEAPPVVTCAVPPSPCPCVSASKVMTTEVLVSTLSDPSLSMSTQEGPSNGLACSSTAMDPSLSPAPINLPVVDLPVVSGPPLVPLPPHP